MTRQEEVGLYKDIARQSRKLARDIEKSLLSQGPHGLYPKKAIDIILSRIRPKAVRGFSFCRAEPPDDPLKIITSFP